MEDDFSISTQLNQMQSWNDDVYERFIKVCDCDFKQVGVVNNLNKYNIINLVNLSDSYWRGVGERLESELLSSYSYHIEKLMAEVEARKLLHPEYFI